jgi:hypothetical protein
VKSSQDKIKWRTGLLHEQVIKVLRLLLDGRQDEVPVFQCSSFLNWVKRQKSPFTDVKPFHLGGIHKFAEQHSDVIQWSNQIESMLSLTACQE